MMCKDSTSDQAVYEEVIEELKYIYILECNVNLIQDPLSIHRQDFSKLRTGPQ